MLNQEYETVVNNLEELLEVYPPTIIEIPLELRPILEKNLERLLKEEHFEIAYEICPDRTIESFIKSNPSEALIYSYYTDKEHLADEAIEYLLKSPNEKSKEILEVYKELPMSYCIDRLFNNIKVTNLDHFGEIHQHALELRDTDTLSKITHELFDSNPTNIEELLEILALAKESREYLIEKAVENAIEDALVQEGVTEYTTLIEIGLKLIDQVKRDFGGDFPTRIQPGGPEGSYASIRYKNLGGANHAYGT
jgi:AcrR family transcriptional regulator